MMKNENSASNFGPGAIQGIQGILGKQPQKQGERRSQIHKALEQIHIETNIGTMGAVGTQMNLHSQPQVASPKAVPDKLAQKPVASADGKIPPKDLSQDSPLRPPKSSTEVGSNLRNHSNQAH